MENIKLEVSDTNKDTEEVALINDVENNNTEISEAVETNNVPEVNDPDAKLSNNDASVILQIIEIIQSRGKIPANNMFITGERYLRLKSYIEFNKLNDQISLLTTSTLAHYHHRSLLPLLHVLMYHCWDLQTMLVRQTRQIHSIQ